MDYFLAAEAPKWLRCSTRRTNAEEEADED